MYTNAIAPVPADDLSTISLGLPVGATFMNREYWKFDLSTDPIAKSQSQGSCLGSGRLG